MVRAELGEPVLKADVYDLEQAIATEVQSRLLGEILDRTLGIEDLVRDRFLFDLHDQLYRDIWQWAGKPATRLRSVGIAPERVAVALRESLDTIRYRWDHTGDWDARALGLAVHAETVRIHPFVDGNGRTTRMLADLVYVAAQHGPEFFVYDWGIDRVSYISVLREYDASRDVRRLVETVPVLAIE